MKQVTSSRHPINFIILLMAIAFTQLGHSQIISGTVKDKTSGNPLENVNIYLAKTNVGTTTNEKGKFNLNLNSLTKQSDSIVFSMVGYRTLKVAVSSLDKKTYNIQLIELTNELGEVVVGGKRKLQSKLKFKELSQLRSGVFAFGSIIVGDKLYLIGGSNSVEEEVVRKAIHDANLKYAPEPTWNDVLNELEPDGSRIGYNNHLLVYDFKTDIWQKTNFQFGDRSHHQLIAYQNNIYALGGKKKESSGGKEYLLNTIEILNLDSLRIVTDQANPHQAVNFATCTYKDNILVMGGSNKITKSGNKVFSDKVHFFNITTGYWYEIGNMTSAKETNGVIIEDKVYLIGGFNGKALSEIESLDLNTGQWKKEGDLFQEMKNPSVATNNGLIYIFDSGKLSVYDTEKNSLITYNLDLFLENAGLHYHQNKLYLIGGYTEEDFSKIPSPKLFEIDLDQLYKTKIQDSKNLSVQLE